MRETKINFIFIFLFLNVISTNANNLLKVFGIKNDTIQQVYLKLYSDNTYEFLVFKRISLVSSLFKEEGKYTWKKQTLKLHRTNPKRNVEYPLNYSYDLSQHLLSEADKKKIWQGEGLVLQEYVDNIYWARTYNDSIYGLIENYEITQDNQTQYGTRIIQQPKVAIKYKNVIIIRDERAKTFDTVDLNLKGNYVSRDSLKKLKVVLTVGACEEHTTEFIYHFMRLAKYIRGLGCDVYELYGKESRWENIKKYTQGAHIFMYAGHGGQNGGMDLGMVGGIYLSEFVYSENLMEDLNLHPNALVVMNHACNSSGSSETDGSILPNWLASMRASEFAYPFLANSNRAYFASNYFDLTLFFQFFFRGYNIETSYDNYSVGFGQTDNYLKQPFRYMQGYDLKMGFFERVNEVKKVSKETISKGYFVRHNNFVSTRINKPNYSIKNLFK